MIFKSSRVPSLLPDPRDAVILQLHDALRSLLDRDMLNTCLHEDTYRGGHIWEICRACGAKWADDEGGRPEDVDPPEWGLAETALRSAKAYIKQPPV